MRNILTRSESDPRCLAGVEDHLREPSQEPKDGPALNAQLSSVKGFKGSPFEIHEVRELPSCRRREQLSWLILSRNFMMGGAELQSGNAIF